MKRDGTEHGDFARLGYCVIPQLVPEPARAFVYEYALKSVRAGKLDPGDQYVPNSPCRYADPMMEALLKVLLPRIATETRRPLWPTYSYFRVYQHGAVLNAHRDRASCEVSVTLNLGHDADAPWPFWIETEGGRTSVELEPGDGMVYKGVEIRHWRNAFTGSRSVQVFLHYVDQNGPYREWKFDRRAALAISLAAERSIEMLMARSESNAHDGRSDVSAAT